MMETSRRNLLRTGLAVGGGLLVELYLPLRARGETPPGGDADAAQQPQPAAPGVFAPNAYIRIPPSGPITFIMSNTECGQGIYTSSCMLLAEELEVDMDQILPEAAEPDGRLYLNPLLGEQATGGSTSTMSSFDPLRKAGATARTMLVAAAARKWRVDPASCQAAQGVVSHAATRRSLSYGQLASAAAAEHAPVDVKLKDPAQWRLIGKPVHRLDTPDKVNGAMRFGIDVAVPGMKFATVAACPVIGGKLLGIDEAAARAVPGVRDVVKLDDAVAVVGDHTWAAISGLREAAARWHDGANGGLSTPGIIAALSQASQTGEPVIANRQGDAAAAIGAAAQRLDAVYQLPFLSHAPMEPINCTIHIRTDGADVWTGTQVPGRAQAVVAKVAGLKPEQVVMHNQYMGGAFGRRLDVDGVEQAARIAKDLGYPVKITWTREEDIQHDLYRPYYYDRISAGLDANGKIAGWQHRTTASSVMARWAPVGMKQDGKLDPDTVEGATDTPYDIPAQLNEYVRHETPGVITAWWRGVGPTHNIFVVEGFIDELAATKGIDALEFRRQHMSQHHPRALHVLNTVAEKSGWGQPLPHGVGRGVAVQFAFNSYVATVIEAGVSDKGEIHLRQIHTAVDCGQVVNPDTVEAQLQGGLLFGLSMAMYSEITHSHGRVDQSNFHDYRMLRMNETPPVHVYIVPTPGAPIGGIGEAGTASAAPALANAIFAASGRRLRRIPFATGQLSAA